MYKHYGFCPACGETTQSEVRGAWLRDQYKCTKCESIPRERALMLVLEKLRPDWRQCRIHESSPNPTGASARLKKECPGYVSSQFFTDTPLGGFHSGVRCENIEKMTFADESIDIHVTQDVLEHVFNPSMAFREIKRTLRPGGIHLFTTPITETGDSTCCAALDADGKIVHLRPPEFHGNPISPEGCLVTWKWGRDLPHRIFESCGLLTSTYVTEAQEFGIKGEYIEVMVTWKR